MINACKKKIVRFGTDGWRAVISENFTMDNVEKVTQAICDTLKEKRVLSSPKIVIGYDTRFLSKEYASRIAEVFLGNNFFVILSSKFTPTPVLSHCVVEFKAVAGIVVTASHNSFQFNGIKLKDFYGGPISAKFTEQVELVVEKNKVLKKSIANGLKEGLLVIKDFDPIYFNFVRSFINIDKILLTDLAIVNDSMYGAGQGYIESLLGSTFHGKIHSIHKTINPGFGGVAPEPIEKNMTELIQMCRLSFDIGLAMDGDADRIGVVDEKGSFVFSHQIIALFFLYLIESRRWSGGIVKSLSTTTLLDVIAKDKNRVCYETPIGFKNISKIMLSEDILIGGEESGGIGFKNHVPERDGILSALLLLEILAFHKKPLSEILKTMEKKYGRFYYKRKDVSSRHIDVAALKKSKKPQMIDQVSVHSIDTRDGEKYLLKDGSWILLRLSGTEPVLRIYAESQTEKRVDRLIAWGESFCLENCLS